MFVVIHPWSWWQLSLLSYGKPVLLFPLRVNVVNLSSFPIRYGSFSNPQTVSPWVRFGVSGSTANLRSPSNKKNVLSKWWVSQSMATKLNTLWLWLTVRHGTWSIEIDDLLIKSMVDLSMAMLVITRWYTKLHPSKTIQVLSTEKLGQSYCFWCVVTSCCACRFCALAVGRQSHGKSLDEQ